MKCGCTDHSFQSDHYKQKETGNSHNFSSRVYSWCQIDLLELRTESFWWCESKLIARLSSLNRDTWRGLHTLHCSTRQDLTKIKTRTGTGSTMYTRLYKNRDKYEDRNKWNVCLVAVKLFKESKAKTGFSLKDSETGWLVKFRSFDDIDSYAHCSIQTNFGQLPQKGERKWRIEVRKLSNNRICPPEKSGLMIPFYSFGALCTCR